MFRIILIIILILFAVPFFNKAKDFYHEKISKVDVIGTTAKKVFSYGKGK